MDTIATAQIVIPEGAAEIVSEIKNKVGDVLLSNSKNRYELKTRIIEDATDMTTKEKLDAMDANYDRHVAETVGVYIVCVALGLLVVSVATGKIPLIKQALRFLA